MNRSVTASNVPAPAEILTPRAAVALILAATLLAFLPVPKGTFLNWDDGANFLENFNFRGLGWSQLVWMWTTFHMGHYQPLSWMTLGLDYLIWGMDPRGFHLTNLLIHCANAALVFFVARRVLTKVVGTNSNAGPLAAALFFSIHPLRVESVAWVTERRDLASGFFYLLSVLSYLNAFEHLGRKKYYFRIAFLCFIASLLSKSIGVTLPIVLLLIDGYLLRRIPLAPGRWTWAESKPLLIEKVPFLAASAAIGTIAVLAQSRTGVLAYTAPIGMLERLKLAVFAAAFYLWKTVLPLGLSPLYSRPVDLGVWRREVLISGAGLLIVAALAAGTARRRPGFLIAFLFYLITVFPVLGFLLSGIYAAADRYTYLPCLSWAMLVGTSIEWARLALRRNGRPALGSAMCAYFLGIGLLTRTQAAVWHDSISLWRQALAVNPKCAPAHNNMGTALARIGREDRAALEFKAAIALDPNYAEAYNNLGTIFVHQSDLDDADAEYRLALRAEPNYAMARDNLGAVLAGEGKIDEAIAELEEEIAVNPGDAHAHNNLGDAFARRGEPERAAAEYRTALNLSPHYAQASKNLGTIRNRR